MRILKRQKGLPFLLALGVLFVLSASFLGVQLWSDKQTMRGAVQALEAPVMPPAMPKVVAPPPIKKTAKTQPAKSEVSPAEVESEPVAVAEPAPDINAAEVKIAAPVEKAPAKEAFPAPVVEQVKPVVVPVEKAEKKEEKNASAPKKIENTVNIDKKAEKPVKSAKKTKKARKTVEPVPTEIPAEWNWFAQPLKLSFDNGKAVIDRSENDKAISLSSGEKVVTSPVVADVVVSEEEKQPVEAAATESVEPSVEKPFMLALAKMTRIRQMRHQKTTSEVDAVEVKRAELSPSLKAIGSKLRELCEKLERRDVAASDSLTASEKTEPVAAADSKVEVADQNTQEASSVTTEATATESVVSSEQVENPAADLSLKPYYSGSGSSFSSRINSMLKQGLIRAE